LTLRPPETEFDRGIRHFGYLLTVTMLLMVLAVFVVHVFNGRPPLETLLFAVALAVGLSPELLPAILSVNLARGAQIMSTRGVLVRRLNAIENLGSMDVLCSDKTGTITEGVVQLQGSFDPSGAPSAEVLRLAACNAALASGLPNLLDDAILDAASADVTAFRKSAEIPFDAVRKRASVVVSTAGGARLITKGAYRAVLDVCGDLPDGAPLDSAARSRLDAQYDAWSEQGIRVLAVAARTLAHDAPAGRELETGLTFAGFLTFLDRPKEDAAAAILALAGQGVAVKIITGDAKPVAQHVARLVGLRAERTLTGAQLQDKIGRASCRERV